MINIKEKLEKQLEEIEERLPNTDTFDEWSSLQHAKATILLALQKYETKEE